MNLKELKKPLTIDQIDFRVQSINKGGYALILAYKDARVDMNRLNEVFGVGNWQRKHEMIGDRLYCSVGIRNDDGEWAWVQDVGTESNTEKEKGQASDSFKRACFNLGIGIELYDYPAIKVKLKDGEWELYNGKPKATWNLKLREWVWESMFDNGKIVYLCAKENGNIRFEWKVDSLQGKVSPELIDLSKVTKAVNYFKEKINEDDWGNATQVQNAYSRLTNDEKLKVEEQLKDKAPGSNKMYKSILKEYLKYQPEEVA